MGHADRGWGGVAVALPSCCCAASLISPKIPNNTPPQQTPLPPRPPTPCEFSCGRADGHIDRFPRNPPSCLRSGFTAPGLAPAWHSPLFLQVLFCCESTDRRYLHTATLPGAKNTLCHEVNCAPNPFSWRLQVYDGDPIDPSVIHVGDPVMMFHKEFGGYFSAKALDCEPTVCGVRTRA